VGRPFYTFVAAGGTRRRLRSEQTASERFEIELTIDGERVKTVHRGAGGARRWWSGAGVGGGGGVRWRCRCSFPVKAGHARHRGSLPGTGGRAPRIAGVCRNRRGEASSRGALERDDHGPDEATGVGDTPSRRRIFVCHPGAAADAGTSGTARPRGARRHGVCPADSLHAGPPSVSTSGDRARRRAAAEVLRDRGARKAGSNVGIRRAIDGCW
jgi:hypothetical protein